MSKYECSALQSEVGARRWKLGGWCASQFGVKKCERLKSCFELTKMSRNCAASECLT